MKNLLSRSVMLFSLFFLIFAWHLNAQGNSIKGKLYGVGSGGQIGEWNRTSFVVMDDKHTYRSIAVNPITGETYVLGSGANAADYYWKEKRAENWRYIDGWHLTSIAFTKKGVMWATGTGGQLAEWDGIKWINHEYWGGWHLKDVAFDKNDVMWGVGTGGQLGRWNGANWEQKGNWTLLSIAFDRDNQLWCVNNGNSAGKWNGTSWENQGKLGGWSLHSLLFLEEDPIIKAAEGGWEDLPSTNVASIRILQGGTTIETTVSSSIGTSLLTANENSRTKDWSITESVSIEKEGTAPLVGKVNATLGFSSTQSESVTSSIKKQRETSLNESTDWKISQPCPPTQDGYVRFAITENVTRVRRNPMSISVPGRETVYMQEYVNLTVVNFSKEYKTSSPEIQAYWIELSSQNPQLMSTQEYELYVR